MTGDALGAAAGDRATARRAAGGDAAAFAALVAPHRRQLYAVCRRVTCHDEDAQEALQDALVTAWRKMHTFDGRSSVGTWLYRIATNAAIDEVRRRGRAPRPIETLPDDQTEGGVDRTVVAKVDVDRALAQIPPQFRAVLVLREMCDLTYLEIAELRGIPVDTVKSQLSRGRQAMIALLRDPVAAAG